MYDSVIDSFVDHTVIKIENNMHITADESNYEYQEYLEWINKGNIPQEWNPNATK
jgi:hypothetical protein